MAEVAAAGDNRITVSGDLLAADAVLACRVGQALIAAAPGGTVEVSLGSLARVSSASAAVLIEWRRVARRAGKTLQLRDVPERLAGILRVSGLDTFLDRA